jgi:hypothetical protein
VEDAEALTDTGDELAFLAAARAQLVVDGRGFDLAGTGGGGEQEQSEAIRPAGNRDADPGVRLSERRQIGFEAGNLFRGGSKRVGQCLLVIASAAKQSSLAQLDCFVATLLAMT